MAGMAHPWPVTPYHDDYVQQYDLAQAQLDKAERQVRAGKSAEIEVTRAAEIVWEFVNPYEFPHRGDQRNRAIFRAVKYAADGPELKNRV
jgi:hypothetical protein